MPNRLNARLKSRSLAFDLRAAAAVLLALSSASLGLAPHARASGADVFARILGRLAAERSLTASRYVLSRSPELRDFSRAVLGSDAAGVEEARLAETAIQRLRAEGQVRLASDLEKRLASLEEAFAAELAISPGADMDALLGRLSSEHFRFRQVSAPRGKGRARIEFESRAPLTPNETALAKAYGSEPELNRLRQAVHSLHGASPELKLEQALEAYDRLLAAGPAFERRFPKALVYQQLADAELTGFSENLAWAFELIERAPAAMAEDQRIRAALRRVLRDQVPAHSVGARIEAFMAGKAGAFRRALGDMTLAETQQLFHGGDPLNPSPESLLGRYLRETGATTSVRTFEDKAAVEAGVAGAQGPRRLMVSVSEESLPAFLKYFKRKEWTSVIGHANMIHEGTVTTFGGEQGAIRISDREYTPFPVLLLKPTEGQRVRQYLHLFRESPFHGFDNDAAAPWSLDNYCAKSAWAGGCTQHWGNMPIGDEMVLEYTMPGRGPGRDALNPAPAVQRLTPHGKTDALIQRVWKVPGHMQISEVIGQQAANLRGELANPGWLIWTLLGPTSAERVPIVFVTRSDHRLPIAADFVPSVERPH